MCCETSKNLNEHEMFFLTCVCTTALHDMQERIHEVFCSLIFALMIMLGALSALREDPRRYKLAKCCLKNSGAGAANVPSTFQSRASIPESCFPATS
ncbi:hypothetical protein N431DRAFT_203789 [Stipitochalara longipes BDJ]|nr:hypothetical protein N431DRAFT_203789 [Stipitochalara longipes BDJ]